MSYQTLLRGLLTVMFLMEMISIVNGRIIQAPTQAKKIPQFGFQDENGVFMDGNMRSFPAALREMDKSVQAELDKKKCTIHPQELDFRVDGRRISEQKCLEYIWEIKKDEGQKSSLSQCPPGMAGITGGTSSNSGKYPHMGAVGWRTSEEGKWDFRCGGSLISDNFVLTAAHCAPKEHPAIVRFGVVDITDETYVKDFDVEDFIKHDKYDGRYKNYDIALIKLAKVVKFKGSISPACVLYQPHVTQAKITGWGAISNENNINRIISKDLLYAEVDVLENDICQERWSRKYDSSEWENYFEGEQICATELEGEGDICGGDSGGPLQTELHIGTSNLTATPIHNIVGVASFSATCGGKNFPSIFTNVNFHLDWIENVVWKTPTKNKKINILELRIIKQSED